MQAQDLAFYNAGCQGLSGPKKVVVPFRRLLRRILRPIFFRQVEILQHIIARLDAADLEQKQLRGEVETIGGIAWDRVAVMRRLAVLEDRIEALACRVERDEEGAADSTIRLVGQHATEGQKRPRAESA